MDVRFLTNDSRFADLCTDALREDMEGAGLSASHRTYYRLLRPLIPVRARQWLQRLRGAGADTNGFFPEAFMKRLAGALESGGPLELVHPWPNGHGFAFVLTHDVESVQGLRSAIALADIEEELGFRSSFNIVPMEYPVDPGIIRELANRGFEIGIHGYNHDGRLFWSKDGFDQRVPAMNAALAEYEASGFRSPMVHRNLEWMQALEIDYDSSCFDADPFQAMAGGIGMVWPSITGRFVELPYTLPQDHTLFVMLGEHDDRIWQEKLKYLAARSGLALMLTHPDYLQSPERRRVYSDFLSAVREHGEMWHGLPRQVAKWWRARDKLALTRDPNGALRIVGPVSESGGVPALFYSEDGVPTFRHLAPGVPASRAVPVRGPAESESP